MLIVGLTGGIGSGKSFVAALFSELGVEVIDADQIARDVVKPNTPALEKIQQRFGEDVVNNLGELDRSHLREKIFQHPEDKNWLEELLHPLIRAAIQQRVAKINAPYCIIEIPLLFESKPNKSLNRILVVDTPEAIQVMRTMQRDKVSEQHVLDIMSSQVSRELRLAGADDVIYNDKDMTLVKEQIAALHKQYSEHNG